MTRTIFTLVVIATAALATASSAMAQTSVPRPGYEPVAGTGSGGGSLPFTGLDVRTMLLIGGALLVAGIVMRRAAGHHA